MKTTTQGVWFYASPTLVIRIDRFFDQEAVLTWYEAQIYCDLNAERVGSILYNPQKPQSKHVQAALIAKQNQTVWGMNTDYYTYRVGRKTITGMVIRNGQVFYDRVPEANRHQFPNLDTLAMLEDGSWHVFHSDEHTAQEYLDMGAVDVFSFGPYLIRDGEINPFLAEMTNGLTPQPRCAIGMVEPGHYFAAVAEGRIRNVSVGVSVAQMAEWMQKGGCREALNLDGGQTAVMAFMGKQKSPGSANMTAAKPAPARQPKSSASADRLDRPQRQITKRAEPVFAPAERLQNIKVPSRGQFFAVPFPIHLYATKTRMQPFEQGRCMRVIFSNQRIRKRRRGRSLFI